MPMLTLFTVTRTLMLGAFETRIVSLPPLPRTRSALLLGSHGSVTTCTVGEAVLVGVKVGVLVGVFVEVLVGVLVDVSVAVGGTAVLVGVLVKVGVYVAVGGTGVLVSVAVGGTGVLVSVAVGGIGVPVGAQGAISDTSSTYMAISRGFQGAQISQCVRNVMRTVCPAKAPMSYVTLVQ